MGSLVGKETQFTVPIWSAKKAREILDEWLDEPRRSPHVLNIEYEEDNFLILVVFTVTVWGDARKVNEITETIGNQLKVL
jgi:hypothetical protein